MIIVKLKGGLGNQLFQYAIGRNLAEIHKTTVKIDVSYFANYKLHAYSLSPFNIQENIASTEECRVKPDDKSKLFEWFNNILCINTVKKTHILKYILEKNFYYDSEILKLHDGIYLDGYWQSEKYFIDIARIIHKEFSVKNPQTGKNKEIADKILSCHSVSIHIRRGSYVLPPYNSFHGTCSIEYYHRCINHLVQKVKNPHFFIFSDDPEWVSENLHINHPVTYINHNGVAGDYEDLRLMTQCNHHIIANSTFSWWGAWLSKNNNKIILTPNPWFRNSQLDTRDLIPSGWIKVDNSIS